MSESTPLIVSVSGIRGIVDGSLTPEIVHRFAAAFATSLEEGARVVQARDTRPSGERLSHYTSAALQEAGCRVLDLGPCSTPAAKLMVAELKANGGVILTASHNPAPWNGLKLVRGDGVFLNAEQGRQVEEIFRSGQFRRRPGGCQEQLDPAEVKRIHLQRLLAHIDQDQIRRAGLKAAVDPCNGTGSLLVPDLLEALGVSAVFINAEPNGRFAHEPEPLPENLVQLGEAVRANGCAVGFAIDPDADRVALVDERGQPVGEDYTLALAVQEVTAQRPGPVVTTLSTSQIVTDVARRNGCPVFLTPVGEVHVVEKMLEVGAAIGGEGNGGVILMQIDPGRDAAVGIAIVLAAMAHSGKTLSQLIQELPRYAIEKRKVTATAAQLERAVQILQRRYPRAYLHPVRDGAKFYLNGELQCPWIHLRASNTEPVVRIIAEGESEEAVSRMCAEAASLLEGKD